MGNDGMVKEDKYMEYRGINYEAWKDGGFIVDIEGDEIFCDTLDAVKQLIDEYLV